MSLFQHTILKKQILASSGKIREAYKVYAAYFHNPEIQENIRNSKEEQFQEGFLRELFVKILGYTLNPEHQYFLIMFTTKQIKQYQWTNNALSNTNPISIK